MNSAHTLQRVILPSSQDPDLLPLYVDTARDASSSSLDADVLVLNTVEERPDHVLDQRRLLVKSGSRMSFATYFNAFPASYWQEWTALTEVELAVRVSGPARIVVPGPAPATGTPP